MKILLSFVIVLSLALPVGFISSCTSSTQSMTIVVVDTFVFAKQPTGAMAGARFTTQPVVHVTDQNGKIDTAYNGAVTLNIASNLNPSGGKLTGTTTVSAVAGVATFTDLSINLAGNGYALMASQGNLTPSLSHTFKVTAAAPPNSTTLSTSATKT